MIRFCGAGGGIRTPNLLIRRRLKPYFRRFTQFRKLAEQGKYNSRFSGIPCFSLRLLSRLLSPTRLKTPDNSTSRLAQLLLVALAISAIHLFTFATASSIVRDRFACAEA